MNFNLPDEILECIFSYLNIVDLVNASLVNKDWYRVATIPRLWKHVNISVNIRHIENLCAQMYTESIENLKLKVREGPDDMVWLYQRGGYCMNVLESFSHLKCLVITYETPNGLSIYDQGKFFVSFSKFPSSLTHVHLVNIYVADRDLVNLSKSCPNLNYINIQKCTGMTCKGINLFLKNLQNQLQHIYLDCLAIKKARTYLMLTKCSNLISLGLVHHRNLPDIFFSHLSKIPTLLRLHLMSGGRIDFSNGTNDFVYKFKALKELMLQNCFRIHKLSCVFISMPALERLCIVQSWHSTLIPSDIQDSLEESLLQCITCVSNKSFKEMYFKMESADLTKFVKKVADSFHETGSDFNICFCHTRDLLTNTSLSAFIESRISCQSSHGRLNKKAFCGCYKPKPNPTYFSYQER